ncbi:Hypothetical protein LUCI_3259 [Lucifera butyrica]|uniref:TIGR00375 family protein n=1 Tax=Lucifera butyrica TaxID=1351585 RepID=A0A498R8Z1_9FIRM|nr:endonuclease Q family protein [Lucifera butyrica]VBB07994.1 Hypothetical protein LUCI_3259 [Lucifera butyrica]
MKHYFVDLHVHVGMTECGKWVKIPTSRLLTVRNILEKAARQKGLHLLGIVDALSPLVISDIERLIEEGKLVPYTGGGYCFENKISLLLGAEIETAEEDGGLSHTLIFLPDLNSMKSFSEYMAQFIRNINLSSQNAHMPLSKLIHIAGGLFEAVIIPAHVFTPFKGLYGACTARMATILSDKEMQKIAAVELGLSADSDMADRIEELQSFTFVSDSDAHSLAKIAREYNVMNLARPDFAECRAALTVRNGRSVVANYGLDPRLGKYHHTFCNACGFQGGGAGISFCPECGSKKITRGVLNRIHQIADFSLPRHPANRPPYHYQIPLEFIPGLGPRALDKLLAIFGTEMNVIHYADYEAIAAVAGEGVARHIAAARSGSAAIVAGGGGIYGKLERKKNPVKE